MNQLVINIQWMSLNVFLAIIPIFLGIFMGKSKSFVKFIYLFLWLLFLPNTLYLVSDPINIPHDARLIFGLPFLVDVFLYVDLVIIGIFTYVFSISLFRKAFSKIRDRDFSLIVFGINLLLGFGIILGRIERINSWEAVTNFPKVIDSSFKILKNPELILFVIVWGLFAQAVFILFRKSIIK